MKPTSVMLVLFLGFSSGGILFAQGVDVTGKWNMTSTSPWGERTGVIECIQNGEDLTVMMTGREGEKMEGKGTVKGSDIEWALTRETSWGTSTSTYVGKVEGDAMKGTIKYGTRGTGEWSAKRVPQGPDPEYMRVTRTNRGLPWELTKLPAASEAVIERLGSRRLSIGETRPARLTDLEFIQEGANLVIIGNPGTEKTFLAKAIGRRA